MSIIKKGGKYTLNKKMKELIQQERDKRSQELFNRNESELSLQEILKLDKYIHDISNPIWKDVIYNGESTNYQVSNIGEVYNKNTQKYSKIRYTNNGYLTTIIYHKGKSNNISIHRLVALAFIDNDDKINKTQVDHLNGKKDCNWVGNLEWVTPKENTRRAILNGLTNPKFRNQVRGSRSGVSKHMEEDAHKVCKLLEKGKSNKEIADELNLTTEFVRSIKRKRAWIHVSKNYTIPSPEIRNYYSDEFRIKIRKMIDDGFTDYEICKTLDIPNIDNYGKRYVNKIRSRYNKGKSSTTIP